MFCESRGIYHLASRAAHTRRSKHLAFRKKPRVFDLMGGGYVPPHKRGGDSGSGAGGGGKGRNQQRGGGGGSRPGSARGAGGGGGNAAVLAEAMRIKETAEKKAASQPDVACQRFEQAAVRS